MKPIKKDKLLMINPTPGLKILIMIPPKPGATNTAAWKTPVFIELTS